MGEEVLRPEPPPGFAFDCSGKRMSSTNLTLHKNKFCLKHLAVKGILYDKNENRKLNLQCFNIHVTINHCEPSKYNIKSTILYP